MPNNCCAGVILQAFACTDMNETDVQRLFLKGAAGPWVYWKPNSHGGPMNLAVMSHDGGQ